MNAPAIPDVLTGLAREAWESWAPIIWQNGHLTDETRETVIQACQDWGLWEQDQRFGDADHDNPEAHATFMKIHHGDAS